MFTSRGYLRSWWVGQGRGEQLQRVMALGKTGDCLHALKFIFHSIPKTGLAGSSSWECVQAKHNVRLLQSLEISVWFQGLFQGFQFLCPVREMLQNMEWTALLSPQRCRWVLVKEDLLLQPKTWHRHHFTALSDFNLMEPSLFKSHHSGLTTGVKIFNRNVSVCNYNWILQTSSLHYIAHAMISFSSVLLWEKSLVYHQHELLCREFMRAGAQERNG